MVKLQKHKIMNKNILKEIENGKYKNHYLIYNRKSTDEPDSQKNSIQYQKTENGKYSINNHLKIAPISIKGFCADGVISEKHSGFKEDLTITFTDDGQVQYKIDRPKFQKMAQFLNKRLLKGVVILCWDRVSRNKADDTLIRKLMKQGIDFRFTYADYDKTSSGALHMDIDGMFAEHHSRVTSEKVKLTTRNLRDQGICTYRAPIGYINTGDKLEKPFDAEREPIIREAFKKYSTGDWSIPDLTKWCNEQGLTTFPMRRPRTEDEMLAEEEDVVEIKPTSRPVNTSLIHRMLNNRFYTGRILGNNNEWIISISHEALVDNETFEKVRKNLQNKRVSIRYTDKLVYPYRAFARCGDCNRAYCPYKKKGKVYFGARCQTDCSNKLKSISTDFIEEKLGEKIKNLYFTKKEKEEIDSRTHSDLNRFEDKRKKEIDQLERQKKKIREDLDYLRTNKLSLLKTGAYSPEELIEEENKLDGQLEKVQNQESISDRAISEVVKDLLKLSELLENGSIYWDYANTEEREQIAKIIFSELFVSENSVDFKLKTGFKPFETRISTLGELYPI